MEAGPSRPPKRPAHDPAVERQQPRGPDGVRLTDLPDDLLRVVAQRVADVPGQYVAGELLPWLLTCRRLATVGYSVVERLTVSPRLHLCSSSCILPGSTVKDLEGSQGQETVQRLSSLLGFLSHVHYVRAVKLQLSACCRRHECETMDVSNLWFGSVLGALSRQPIRSLTACGAAVSALADRQTGSVPLLRVELRCMDLCDEGHERGATSVLSQHQRSLEVLRMDFVFNSRKKELSRRPWSVKSLLRHIGSLPALKELSLDAMSSADAAAVAAACPELESLTLLADDVLLDKRVWRCLRYPEALPRLSSLVLPNNVRGSGFSLMVGGRRLRQLVTPAYRSSNGSHRLPRDGDFLEAAAALPQVLHICWMCEVKLLERLAGGPAEVASLRQLNIFVMNMSASTLAPLSRLTGLTHLRLRVDVLSAAVWWPPLVGLQFLRVDDLFHGVASLMTGLADSPTRLSLTVLHLDVAARVTFTDEAVEAAAPWLVALRQLKIGRAEWALARGTVLGRWPARKMR